MGYLMSKAEIPLAPAILGIVLGKIIEDNFMVSMMKAQGNFLTFFDRSYSLALGIVTVIHLGSAYHQGSARDGRRRSADHRNAKIPEIQNSKI